MRVRSAGGAEDAAVDGPVPDSGHRDRAPSRGPRIRTALVAGFSAALVVALLSAVWLIADRVAARDGVGSADPYAPIRLWPVVQGTAWFGVPGGVLLVGLAVWGVARRWWVVCVVGGVTGSLLWAHAVWVEALNEAAPWQTASAALRAGFGFAVPVTSLAVAFTAWVAAEPLGRLVPWRKGAWRAPVALGAVIVAAGAVWGVVQPWDRMPNDAEDNGHALWLLLTCGTLLLVVTGWAAARLTLRPVEAMRAELADITARSLDRRVPVPAIGGVLQKLARTLNATLDRLQSAADRQARFVADASHELRSPIASLRASLESSLTHPGGVDWPHTVRGTLTDIERIQHLTDDLLLLTRIDGPAPHADESVPLADLASDLVEELRHLRRNSALRVTCTAPADLPPLTGSQVRLERLLRNLLDNACRHARSEVGAVLSTDAGRRTVRVEVRDDGPGIPPADRERVFERFTRLDDSRTRADGGGAGLGLAIAREIAVRQGGTLVVGERGPGGEGRGAVLIAEFPVGAVREDLATGAEEVPDAPRRHLAGWIAGGVLAVAVPLLAVGFATTVSGPRSPGVVGATPAPAPTPTVQASPEPSGSAMGLLQPRVEHLQDGDAHAALSFYAPARTEEEGWQQLAAIDGLWPGSVPGGSVRTPGAKLPYPLGRTVFTASLGTEEKPFGYGALPAPGTGPTGTAAAKVRAGPGPDGVEQSAELVLGWAPPTVGAIGYRWSDGTEVRPQLRRLPGSDRLWFVVQGPPGATSRGYDVYDLADRRTVGNR
ncbi:sensor histidine kinase [Streptomyces sp. NPDC021093]|uniref:sensor histidine kinase n=1 Tax=Streptomyces sp. NPDC021093 TaxID=3365112 RepID=UPI0037954DF3